MSMKKEIQKQSSTGLIGGLLAVCLVAVLGFGVIGFAAYSGFNQTFTGDVTINQNAVGGADYSEGSLGSSGPTATTTPTDGFTNFDNVSVTNCYRIGDEAAVNTESVTRCLIVQDFTDATTTPINLINPFDADDQVYVVDAWVQVLGKATSTVKFMMTTSTATGLNVETDMGAWLADDTGDGDGGVNVPVLMRGFGNAWGADGGAVATGTNFFLYNQTGHATSTDTNVAAGKGPIEWPNDVYWYVVATSSGTNIQNGNCAIVCSDNIFHGELYMVVDIIK